MITKEKQLEYQTISQKDLDLSFIELCKTGSINDIKYILTSPDLIKHADIHTSDDIGFIMACENGHLDIVKYLLTSSELIEHANINANEDAGLQCACYGGHLEIVKYLLTSPELKEHSHINATDEGYALGSAANNGHLHVIKYLLTSPELTEHADIRLSNNVALISACKEGDLEIVKYLLTSPELKKHSEITYDSLSGACEYEHLEIIEYLLTLSEEDQINHYEMCVMASCTHKSDKNLHFLLTAPHMKHLIDVEMILAFVCDNRYLEALKLLLEFNRNPNGTKIQIRPSNFKVICDNEDMKMLQFLIFDYKMEKTEGIATIAKEYPEVYKMLTLKELEKKLKTDLIINDGVTKKKKI